MIGQSIEGYQIIRLLGQGALGAVYEAVDAGIGRHVAVKILTGRMAQDPQVRARFRNEALASNLVNHPGVVAVFRQGETPDGVLYLIMELLEGITLRARQQQSGRLHWQEVARIARQIADILVAAHQVQVIHRDLKLDNVMLVRDPESPGGQRVKLLDFGIAKIGAAPADRALGRTMVVTLPGAVMGTPGFMPLEQLIDAAAVDGRADVYALAAMGYHLLTSRMPVPLPEGPLVLDELVRCYRVGEPRPLEELGLGVPPRLSRLLAQALHRDAVQRPSMAELAQGLREFCAGQRASAALLPEEPEDDPLQAGQLVGAYRVRQRRARGKDASFYEAVHRDHADLRALIKVTRGVDAASVERALQEARGLLGLRDVGIAQVLDFGVLPTGGAFVTLEYLEGEPLSAQAQFWRGQRGRRGLSRGLSQRRRQQVLSLARQLASSLETAHAARVTHRDLRLEALLCGSDRLHPDEHQIKVFDLGYARALAEQRGLLEARPVQEEAGTAAEDVRALGAVVEALFDAATGSRGPREVQALLVDMQQAVAVQRPAMREVAQRLERLRAMTLVTSWPRAGAVTALSVGGLLLLGVAAKAYWPGALVSPPPPPSPSLGAFNPAPPGGATAVAEPPPPPLRQTGHGSRRPSSRREAGKGEAVPPKDPGPVEGPVNPLESPPDLGLVKSTGGTPPPPPPPPPPRPDVQVRLQVMGCGEVSVAQFPGLRCSSAGDWARCTLPQGERLTLQAKSKELCGFVRWEGCRPADQERCTVQASQNLVVQAFFHGDIDPSERQTGGNIKLGPPPEPHPPKPGQSY